MNGVVTLTQKEMLAVYNAEEIKKAAFDKGYQEGRAAGFAAGYAAARQQPAEKLQRAYEQGVRDAQVMMQKQLLRKNGVGY